MIHASQRTFLSTMSEPLTRSIQPTRASVAAREVLSTFSSCLGPNAMTKLIVNEESRNMVSTSDGGIIAGALLAAEAAVRANDGEGSLKPGGILAVTACVQQARRHGDGVCAMAVLAERLLFNAERLLQRGYHRMTIA